MLATEQPLTPLARDNAEYARPIYIMLVPDDETGGPVQVIRTQRTDPAEAIYTVAAEAVQEHLGVEQVDPVLVGVMPRDGGAGYAVVFAVTVRAGWVL